MIDRKRLLDDLRRLVTKLEKDLRERCEENAEVDARVRLEYDQAKEAKRTAQAYKIWRDEWITQVAVAWVLGAVFVRFIEDNELIATPFIAGPGQRLDFAKEQRTAFFTRNPRLSDREYLEHVFREVAKLPAMKELYDERHNPLWALGVSGDGAKLILEQFQKTDVATGALVHDFTDPAWETRFLGDLYQDLSESARKKYALLQTPEFVEEFILDRTLDPAIAEFGLAEVRMIDPTCGSGHFLLGAFTRIFRLWEAREPATNPAALAQRALDSVYGVDLNPFAIAISRFRLLVAAMQASGVNRLAEAPAFAINLAIGDSLLHGAAGLGGSTQTLFKFSPMTHLYATEDKENLEKILQIGRYHAVVGNPPYIGVKDPALRHAYRDRFRSCHGKYALAAPFFERFFTLAKQRDDKSAGYVGLITANSFMKREFGKKLVESCLPAWDLTHVIDSSGAAIPGHNGNPTGTPTAILFGRNQHPISSTIRTVMGIKGEPSTPADPAHGKVWSAIVNQIDRAGSTSAFVSVADLPRDAFHRHPWSIGGGGAAELKVAIEEHCEARLGEIADSIGFGAILGEDEAFARPITHPSFTAVPPDRHRPLVEGDLVRDWSLTSRTEVLFPYTPDIQLREEEDILRWCWPLRTILRNRRDFGDQTYEEAGRSHVEYHQIPRDKYRTPLSIVFGEIATHNHFVLDRGGKVFNRTAPIIKLPTSATEEDHLALLGLLNSSTACFWGRQTLFPKGGFAAGKWEERLVWGGTKLQSFPIPEDTPVDLARLIDQIATQRARMAPEVVVTPSPGAWDLAGAKNVSDALFRQLVSLQEELDWACYVAYGLVEEAPKALDPPPIASGERAFAIVLAREVRKGGEGESWFTRHGITPVTELPAHWPSDYRSIVEARIRLIENNTTIQLLERPEYKRRWSEEPWEERLHQALREWLATLLVSDVHRQPAIISAAQLAESAKGDQAFQIGAVAFRKGSDFDMATLVDDVVSESAVPMLPIDRYKESGLQKRSTWEDTWSAQRREDAIDARTRLTTSDPRCLSTAAALKLKREHVGDMAAPPKYIPSDFRSGAYWPLRGKLDVPKERFISFPGCERESDSSLPILWAGYDHLQQAKAVAAYYHDLKEKEGAGPAKLGKLLACILELLPWLKQWHNEIDPEYGTRMGDFFETFMLSEMSSLGLSMEELRKIRGL